MMLFKGVSLFVCLMVLLLFGCKKNDSSFFGNIYHHLAAYFNTYYNVEKAFHKVNEKLFLNQDYSENAPLDIFYNASQEVSDDRYNEIIKKASLIIRDHPETYWAQQSFLILGRAYYYTQKYSEADRKFKEFITNYPQSEMYNEGVLWYVRSLVAQGLLSEAKKNLGTLIDLSAASVDIKAQAYFITAEIVLFNETSHGRRLYSKTVAKDINYESRITSEQYKSAVDAIQKGVFFKSDDNIKARAYFVLGKVYSKLRLYQQARESYQRASLTSRGSDLDIVSRLKVAQSYQLEGKFQSALYDYQNILKNPKYQSKVGNILYEIADVYLEMGDDRKAFEFYSEIIRKHPKTEVAAKTFYKLARTQERSFLDFQEASRLYDSAVVSYSRGLVIEKAKRASKRIGKILNILNKYESLQSLLDLGIQRDVKSVDSLDNRRFSIKDGDQYRRRSQYRLSETMLFLEGGGRDAFYSQQSKVRKTSTKAVSYKPPKDSAEFFAYQVEKLNVLAKISSFFYLDINALDTAQKWYQLTLRHIEDVLEDSISSIQPQLGEVKDLHANVLYSYATLLEKVDKNEESNQMKEKILERYPISVYSRYIKRVQGDGISLDRPVKYDKYLYESAFRMFEKGDDSDAFLRLLLVIKKFSASSFGWKSLYLLGDWFEKKGAEKAAVFVYRVFRHAYPEKQLVNEILSFLYSFGVHQEKDSVDSLSTISLLPSDTMSITASIPDTASSHFKEKPALSKMLKRVKDMMEDTPSADSLQILVKKKPIYTILLESDVVCNALSLESVKDSFSAEQIISIREDLVQVLDDVLRLKNKKNEEIF